MEKYLVPLQSNCDTCKNRAGCELKDINSQSYIVRGCAKYKEVLD